MSAPDLAEADRLAKEYTTWPHSDWDGADRTSAKKLARAYLALRSTPTRTAETPTQNVGQIVSALGLFKSVIQAEEIWTDVCQKTFDEAWSAINEIGPLVVEGRTAGEVTRDGVAKILELVSRNALGTYRISKSLQKEVLDAIMPLLTRPGAERAADECERGGDPTHNEISVAKITKVIEKWAAGKPALRPWSHLSMTLLDECGFHDGMIGVQPSAETRTPGMVWVCKNHGIGTCGYWRGKSKADCIDDDCPIRSAQEAK